MASESSTVKKRSFRKLLENGPIIYVQPRFTDTSKCTSDSKGLQFFIAGAHFDDFVDSNTLASTSFSRLLITQAFRTLPSVPMRSAIPTTPRSFRLLERPEKSGLSVSSGCGNLRLHSCFWLAFPFLSVAPPVADKSLL